MAGSDPSGTIHTLGEAAIGHMEDSRILEAIAAVVGMRPAVKSNLATKVLSQRPLRRRLGPRRPAIKQDQLPLVSGSWIEGRRLFSRLGMMPRMDPEGLYPKSAPILAITRYADRSYRSPGDSG